MFKVGASFTGSTVTVKVRVMRSTPPSSVPPLSRTVTVILHGAGSVGHGSVIRDRPVALGLL